LSYLFNVLAYCINIMSQAQLSLTFFYKSSSMFMTFTDWDHQCFIK
jgi:hypothetical protein